MAKFALTANPTFSAKVGFMPAGGEPVDVLLTFKHRTKTALAEFRVVLLDRDDVTNFLDMVNGWDLLDEFNRANVELLLENHIGVAVATYKAYFEELQQHRRGN